MWDRKALEFPWYWDDIMEIAVFDASTFKLYSDNMRSLLAEQVRWAELILFYKADEVREKLASYVRNIKAINWEQGVRTPPEYVIYMLTRIIYLERDKAS